MILVTGSEGLIGRAFCHLLDDRGIDSLHCDLKTGGDVTDLNDVVKWLEDCDGVVHLAAFTRVKRCELDPDAAWNVNAMAVAYLAGVCAAAGKWLVLASSREVYGQQDEFPVNEDAEKRPKNVYAKTKVEAERQVKRDRETGWCANIIRFSNVYGDVEDHSDRLVPAFARAAAENGEIAVEGAGVMLDLVHVEDAAQGLLRLTEATMAGERLPPVHLVSGIGTTVMDVAHLAFLASGSLKVVQREAQPYHVDKFVGCKQRALNLLGWEAKISIEAGFARLVEDFRKVRNGAKSERL